ncbi:Dusp19 [Symbiodinium pilosum]|uniref:Dusp19 protein n=1 Tax=Symbiodinium pilosum TaxID=2952 RepID=A0A812XRX2_SYMPI|nr:Dusp19 [Symbiodinium pilosum]
MASTPAQDAEEADESEVTLEVRLQWQDAGGSQSDQICMVATSTLKELREHCAEMLKVKRIHCPDFNDDMGSQQLQELGIGLSDVPILLELGPPLECAGPAEPKAAAKATSLPRKARAPLAVRQAVEDASDVREGWLFLGGQMAASSLEGLQQIGITHILNCCERVPCKFRSRITYKTIAVMDTKSSDIRDFIPEALAFIDEVVAAGGQRFMNKGRRDDVSTRKSGGSFTAIYESASAGKNFASVNAGNPKKLKVGGGTINGQFAQELQKVAGHDPDSYSPAHEALLRVATQAGARHGLIPAPATLRLPSCLEAAYIYLGRTPAEAEQIAGDSGRGGLVILDMFESKSRPYHEQNVAMVYTVGPQRGYEPDDGTFLSKVRLVGRNVVAACHDYNAQNPPQPIEQVRLCLVSGGKFAERVPKEHVARQLVLGVLDVQLAEWVKADAVPEIEFAYDGDVFRKEWAALVERT